VLAAHNFPSCNFILMRCRKVHIIPYKNIHFYRQYLLKVQINLVLAFMIIKIIIFKMFITLGVEIMLATHSLINIGLMLNSLEMF